MIRWGSMMWSEGSGRVIPTNSFLTVVLVEF